MDLAYERGSDIDPKGHAFLYFRNKSDSDEVWSTYVILLPISVDVSKYVPPFLMNQMPEVGPKDLSAFAFPPAPEKVESYSHIQMLADARDDDIVYGGSFDPADMSSAMLLISEAVQIYADVYSARECLRHAQSIIDEDSPDLAVNEVLYGLMADADKLGELTKLVGRLRFALDGGEQSIARETESDILLLARHLPDNHRILDLVSAAKSGSVHSARLADLYLQRCFHLTKEEYVQLGEVEEKISAIQSAYDSTNEPNESS